MTAARTCPARRSDQCRAATAGTIISPTDISVPNAVNPATTHRTTSAMNAKCHTPPRPPMARRKSGSKLSTTNGRHTTARPSTATLAAPAISSNPGRSTASTLPNNRCIRSMPRVAEMMATPAASASK